MIHHLILIENIKLRAIKNSKFNNYDNKNEIDD